MTHFKWKGGLNIKDFITHESECVSCNCFWEPEIRVSNEIKNNACPYWKITNLPTSEKCRKKWD